MHNLAINGKKSSIITVSYAQVIYARTDDISESDRGAAFKVSPQLLKFLYIYTAEYNTGIINV